MMNKVTNAPMSAPSARSREAAWLAHLELLAGLPYPAMMLMPALLAAVRSGFDADYGNFGWVEGEHLKPSAFWSERMTERCHRWFMANFDRSLSEAPLRAQLESDGDLIRAVVASPGFEDSVNYTELMGPHGVRWSLGAPVLSLDGRCQGFLYLFRRAAAGPFSDQEQASLRQARDRLKGLTSLAPAGARPAAQQVAATATLHVGADGRFLARGDRAIELLYLCNDGRMGLLNWAAPDISALPVSAREMVARLLAGTEGPGVSRCTVALAAGIFEFSVERLRGMADKSLQAAVTISHLEPIDITVARQLLHWPLSPREKRLIVASTREPSQQELAEELGITVSTLKSYINELQARLHVPSRQALIERLLEDARRERAIDLRPERASVS